MKLSFTIKLFNINNSLENMQTSLCVPYDFFFSEKEKLRQQWSKKIILWMKSKLQMNKYFLQQKFNWIWKTSLHQFICDYGFLATFFYKNVNIDCNHFDALILILNFDYHHVRCCCFVFLFLFRSWICLPEILWNSFPENFWNWA